MSWNVVKKFKSLTDFTSSHFCEHFKSLIYKENISLDSDVKMFLDDSYNDVIGLWFYCRLSFKSNLFVKTSKNFWRVFIDPIDFIFPIFKVHRSPL